MGLPPLATADAASVSPKSRAPRAQGETVRRLALPGVLLGSAILLLYGFGRAPCVLALVAHVPCPSCGLTRAARFALHADFAAATHAHPLWSIVLPFATWAFGYEMYKYVQTGQLGAIERLRYAKPVTNALAALLLAVWFARFFGAFGGPVPVSP